MRNPLVILMCLGQIGNLLPHVVVPAVMTEHLMPLWGMSNAQAGLLAAAYAAGYMLAVPVLSSLTDRWDARIVLLWGSLFSALSTLGFGLLAHDMWSATLLWSLAGIGFAGAYMPGLRALTDRLAAGDVSRSVTLYTSSYSLGVGLSFLVSQWVAEHVDWRWSFYVTGLGPLLMVAVAALMKPMPPPPPSGHLLDFRPVLRNRTAMGYILCYGAHCFELYGMRTWIVAFWTFVVQRQSEQPWLSPMEVSVLVTLLAMPASILGNELSLRCGRHRSITWIQVLSAVVALAIGWFADAPSGWLLALVLLYAVTVPADSGSITSGMSASADPRFRGVTLAMHSTVGFGLSALAGWLVGVSLDAFGGAQEPRAWAAGFAVLALGVSVGPLVLWWSRRSGNTP
jgi:predicted MFS family arabinose efflux permease